MPAVLFHRPARVYPDRLPEGPITIDAPPQKPQQQQGISMLLPLMMPVIGSLGSLTFVLAQKPISVISVIAGVGFALFSVGIGLAVRFAQTRAMKKQRASNRKIYAGHLAASAALAEDTVRRQKAFDTRLWPPVNALLPRVTSRDQMWERRLEDFDFLDMRLGVAAAPLCRPVSINLPQGLFLEKTLEHDQLAEARRIEEKYKMLDETPVRIPLRNYGTVSVIGKRPATRALVRAMLCQMAALQAPDDVRIIASFAPAATHEWGWLKWLPHARRLRRTKEPSAQGEIFAMLADAPNDFRDVLENQLRPELERRQKLRADNRNDGVNLNKPHFVIIIDDFKPKTPIAQIPIVDDLLRNPGGQGVTVILLVDDTRQEPSTVNARIEISVGGFLSFEETQLNGLRLMGVFPDRAEVEVSEKIARALAPISLSEQGAEVDLAGDVRLLDLLKIRYSDYVHTKNTWTPRTLADTLRVPIGMRADGEPLILDVKENAAGGMGPHGLVIGATGSGKSELMRSIVTSLAITHSPDVLNFVLADFKGGASFADLQDLPHVSGMVTNLKDDASMLDRFYAALSGEQERRQQMLRDAGNLDKVAAYQEKRAKNPDMPPMPYLLIIIDEFAEMLTNRPDFLELFIGIGRVGRSIGMHLLFATQRLEEGKLKGLDTYLSYRICLRTFSAAESNIMLATPDAFYLPSFPGVGYLKVGTSLYEKFKSAIISNPYMPPATSTQAVLTIREFTPTGKLVDCNLSSLPQHTAVAVANGSEEKTDMKVVIDHLVTETPPPMKNNLHEVWLPPLPRSVTLAEVLERTASGAGALNGSGWQAMPPYGPLRVPVGIEDRPAQQIQVPYYLDFSGAGGHVALVGGPQSGKSTFLRTLISSFMVTHSPRDVQFYCIDYGGGSLRSLEDAPHVGVVCGKGDRDKISRTILQMRGVMEERESLFRRRGIENMAAFRERRRQGDLDDVAFGDVFLVIDDLGQLLRDFDQVEPDLIELIAGGLNYGVHVFIAAGRWAEVRPKLRDNITVRVELRLTEPTESEVGRKEAAALPNGVPGRGINQAKLHYQIALPVVQGDGAQQTTSVADSVAALVKRTRASWRGDGAPKIRLLPLLVKLDELPPVGADLAPGIPIGIDEFKLAPVYLDLLNTGGPHFLVYGDGESGKTNLLHIMLHGLNQRYTPDEVRYVLVDYRRTSLDFAGDPHLFGYAYTAPMLKDQLDKLKKEIDSRIAAISLIPLDEMKKGPTYVGPHYVLFVDDFDNLGQNALQAAGEWILPARDIGFHLVLFRRVAGAGRGFDQVIVKAKEMGTGAMVMSGEPSEGPIAGTQKANLLPPGRGFLVRRGMRTMLVQMARE
jgi:S-DNA-T family DNA segregation ATPase FtsK/SpoIIIE